MRAQQNQSGAQACCSSEQPQYQSACTPSTNANITAPKQAYTHVTVSALAAYLVCNATVSNKLWLAQVYVETAQQAGFDGPYLIELTIMLLLSKVYPCLGSCPAYRRYFHDLPGSDLARARQLTQDPYMLIKFKVTTALTCLCLGCCCSFCCQVLTAQ